MNPSLFSIRKRKIMPGKPWKGDVDRLVHENEELKKDLHKALDENAALPN